MNKSELVQELANRTKMNKAQAQRAVEAMFSANNGIITGALRRGDKVQITGFGTFETRARKARTGRNPRTGKEIKIGPTTSPSFRAGKAFKDSVKTRGR
jgi:nucleoid DNA-binding protein